jgi:hypothetical protein
MKDCARVVNMMRLRALHEWIMENGARGARMENGELKMRARHCEGVAQSNPDGITPLDCFAPL